MAQYGPPPGPSQSVICKHRRRGGFGGGGFRPLDRFGSILACVMAVTLLLLMVDPCQSSGPHLTHHHSKHHHHHRQQHSHQELEQSHHPHHHSMLVHSHRARSVLDPSFSVPSSPGLLMAHTGNHFMSQHSPSSSSSVSQHGPQQSSPPSSSSSVVSSPHGT